MPLIPRVTRSFQCSASEAVAMEKAAFCSGDSIVKGTWDSKENPYAYPWPPRSYTCSFCQREFKSAQALGGHMNIHRRDRARLREQSPTNDPLCPNNSDQNPNPNDPTSNSNTNPNPNLSPLSIQTPNATTTTNTNIYAHQYSLVSLSLSSFPSPAKNGEKFRGPVFRSSNGFERTDIEQGVQGVERWKYMSSAQNSQHEEHEVSVLNNGSSTKEVERLDLELCVGKAKEADLDLELRLGI